MAFALRAQRIAIVDDRTAYGQRLADEVEKAAKALEIAREEQEHIHRDIKRKLENYGKLKRRKAKKVG